ncbi:MAG: nucleotidyl transferase AbiEii/AbiGii toxin family protein [bacterium]|nr:nucleotidyl transferase AbiEii/AbiGii toxin family protein [bacterium]
MFTRTLSENTAAALATLGKSNICNGAYLAGGTALALHLGHRISVDLDFFNPLNFDSHEIVTKLKSLGDFESDQQTEKTINGIFNSVKFSYFYYSYKLIAKTVDFEGITLASLEDIAAMKLVAITDRGTKKDYIDLYFLAQKYSFEEMFDFYEKKYGLIDTNRMIILKSMGYFIDADESEMPLMIEKINWEEVKAFFISQVLRLSKKYLF